MLLLLIPRTSVSENMQPFEVALDPELLDPEKENKQSFSELTNSLGMKFVLIKAGTFIMGSPSRE